MTQAIDSANSMPFPPFHAAIQNHWLHTHPGRHDCQPGKLAPDDASRRAAHRPCAAMPPSSGVREQLAPFPCTPNFGQMRFRQTNQLAAETIACASVDAEGAFPLHAGLFSILWKFSRQRPDCSGTAAIVHSPREWRSRLQGASGSGSSVKLKVEPWFTWLSTQISPPWSCTMCLTIDRPSPVPPSSRERALSTR
jgi:hypothetical protein